MSILTREREADQKQAAKTADRSTDMREPPRRDPVEVAARFLSGEKSDPKYRRLNDKMQSGG